MRCEGYRRRGGAFTLGPVSWSQCIESGVVMLTVEQDGETQTLPACNRCWKEVIENNVPVLKIEPIPEGI